MRFVRVTATGHDGILTLQIDVSFEAFSNLRCATGTRRSGGTNMPLTQLVTLMDGYDQSHEHVSWAY